MHKSSLLTIIISGWGVVSSPPSFLDDILQVYPSFLINCPSNLSLQDRYIIMGTSVSNPLGQQSLSSVLSAHNIRQFRVSGPERYGFLTSSMNGQQASSNPLENYIYVANPPADSLFEIPSGNLFRLHKELKSLFKYREDTVVIANIETIRSISHYQDASVLKQAEGAVEKTVLSLVHAALAANFRTLLISDGGIREETTIPCVLIDKDIEGVRALPELTGQADVLPRHPTATLYDIAPSILDLFSLHIPEYMEGKPLFKSFYV